MRLVLSIASLLVFLSSEAQENPDPYLQARARMTEQQYSQAISILDNVIEANPGNMDALFQRGICYYNSGNFNEAISSFLPVNKRFPAKASLMLARCEARLGHEEMAIKYLREHLESRYRQPEKVILLDKDLSMLENHSLWKKLWQEKEWYTPYDREYMDALYQVANRNYPEALNLLQDLNRKGYNRTDVQEKIAEVYLATGNNKAASEALDESVRADYRNIESLKKRIDLQSLSGNYNKAEEDCRRLLRQAPDQFDYYLVHADLLAETGDFDKAVQQAQFYLELFPDAPAGLNTLGSVYLRNKKYIPALTALNRALEEEHGEPAFFLNRGKAYAATGMQKYAAKDFAMALDLDPLNADTWFAFGLSSIELGDKEKACFQFKKALQYGHTEALDYIQRICK